MHRQAWAGLLICAGIAYGGRPVSAEELTIFWADWDPANYLQELVNQYTAETGVGVTVQTTPWPDFQTKAFMELNAHGDSYDLVVGDSQWLGTGATEGHYVELTDFVVRVDGTPYPEAAVDTGPFHSKPTPSAGRTAKTGSKIHPR